MDHIVNPLKKILAVFLTLCLVLVQPLGTAGVSTASAAPASEKDAALSTIDATLLSSLENLKDDEFASVLIKLKEQAHIREAAKNAVPQPGEGRVIAERKAVIGELEETAHRTQGDLLALLSQLEDEGQARDIKSFFILNMIKADVTKAQLLALAQRPDIQSIYANSKIKQIDPIKDKKRRGKRSVPAEVDGIEMNLKMLSVPRVWNELNIDGTGITVGIIDGGTMYRHPAIVRNYRGFDESQNKVVESQAFYRDFTGSGNVPRPEPSFDHGTHVAGIILGRDGDMNRIGVAPGAKFIAARAIGEQEGNADDLLAAAEWMLMPDGTAESAPRIINNSWGGGNDNDPWFKDVADAWRAANILPVFAAGNARGSAKPKDGSISNPGNLFNVFTVAAVDNESNLAPFSLVGPSAFEKDPAHPTRIKPDVSAPGVQIRSALATGGYGAMSGTSMAAPHVAGVAALMLQANPNLTISQIESILTETSTPKTNERYAQSPNMGFGYGVINAYDAVRKALALKEGDSSDQRISVSGHVLKSGSDQSAPVIVPTVSKQAYRGQAVNVSATITDDVSVTGAQLCFLKDATDPNAQANDAHKIAMTMTAGEVNNGTWTAQITPDLIGDARTLHVWIEATDYGAAATSGAPTVSEKTAVTIVPGIVPGTYRNDFETQADGWTFTGELQDQPADGDWNWGTPTASKEPKPTSGTKLIGTKVGSNKVTKHVDSYAYAPPMDLSDKSLKAVSVSFNEYVGVNGVTECKVQVAPSQNGPWEDLDEKLVAPGTVPVWKKATYNLSKFIGNKNPVHLRLKFHFPDHGEGVGWYVDDFAVERGDTQAPLGVDGLMGTLRGNGAVISWNRSQENDVTAYEIYRVNGAVAEGGKLSSLGEPALVGKVMPDAHRMEFYDPQAAHGTYTYIVRARDSFGNLAPVTQAVVVEGAPRTIVGWDFNENDGGFARGTLEDGGVNDWEHGLIKPVGNDSMTFHFREAQLGLRDKIAAGDKVWGTNLGKQDASLPQGIFNAQVTRGQQSFIETPEISVPQNGATLSFESYNALHYSSDYQENLEQVMISNNGGKSWQVLIPAKTVMNNDNKFMFTWLDADLSPFAGQNVKLRYTLRVSPSHVLNSYEIGWYIDNLVVSDKVVKLTPRAVSEVAAVIAPFSADGSSPASASADKDGAAATAAGAAGSAGAATAAGTADASAPADPAAPLKVAGLPGGALPTGAIPLDNGTIELVELDRSYPAAPATGGFEFKVSKGAWTLRASAYGYETQDLAIEDQKADVHHDFILAPLAKTTITGTVRDQEGNPVADAFVRVLTDSNIAIAKTDNQGVYHLNNVYVGNHTLRAFKKDMGNDDKSLTVEATGSTQDFRLTSNALTPEETVFDNGEPRSNLIFASKGKGAAVRFYPAKKGGQLRSARAYFMPLEGVSNTDVRVMVMQNDENARLVTRADFIAQITPGAWNNFDLERFAIHTDKPFYVIVMQLHDTGKGYGVAIDTRGVEDKEIKHSYLYNGSFIPATSYSVVGSFMIRATMAYPTNAEPNDPEPEDGLVDGAVNETPTEEFTFEDQGDHKVLVKYTGSAKAVKVPARVDDKPVTKIGDNAFAWKSLESLTLPEGITSIGEGAFSGGFKPDAEVTLKLPASVTELGARAFASCGLKTLSIPGVESVGPQVFANNNLGLVIAAPKLKTIDPKAFGDRAPRVYSLIYTLPHNPHNLTDINHFALINPALVIAKTVIEETEETNQTLTLYGPDVPQGTDSYKADLDASAFYRIGQTVTIGAPRNDVVTFLDSEKTVKLTGAQNTVVFAAQYLKGGHKPVYAGERPVVEGWTVPGAAVSANGVEVTADEQGFYKIELPRLDEGNEINLVYTYKGKSIDETFRALARPAGEYAIEPTTSGRVIDYLGSSATPTAPTQVQDVNGQTREVKILGSLSLKDKGLTSIEGLENVETLKTIERGALMGNKLTALHLPNNVKELGSYAAARNALTEVTMPRLLHKLGKGALQHNQLERITLGEYTNHFGAYCLADNLLTSISIPSRIEEMDEGAFMNNRLTNVIFEKRSILTNGIDAASSASAKPAQGHSHIVTALPALAFAYNLLTQVELLDTVQEVAPDAFAGNGVLVNLLTSQPVQDSILAQDSGHIVNGATVTVKLADKNGAQLADPKAWVGNNLEKRIGTDPESFFRIGKEATVAAPELPGYKVVGSTSATIVPDAQGPNEVTFVYEPTNGTDNGSSEPDPKPEPQPGPGPAPQPDPGPAPQPAPGPGPAPQPDPAPQPAPGPDPAPQPAPGPGPIPAPDPLEPSGDDTGNIAKGDTTSSSDTANASVSAGKTTAGKRHARPSAAQKTQDAVTSAPGTLGDMTVADNTAATPVAGEPTTVDATIQPQAPADTDKSAPAASEPQKAAKPDQGSTGTPFALVVGALAIAALVTGLLLFAKRRKDGER